MVGMWRVYRHLAVLEAWGAAHGVPVVRVTAGRLANETYLPKPGHSRRVSLPVFTRDATGEPTIMPRQCTAEYKLDPIKAYLRQRLGYGRGVRIPKGTVTALIGLSFDELIRMKPSRRAWIENRWPLIDAAMTRSACMALLEAHDLPVPEKSACLFCPFHDDRYWQRLQAVEPESFEAACRFDEAIRQIQRPGMTEPVFLHRSLQPLRSVTFREEAPTLDFGFANECEGMCGV